MERSFRGLEIRRQDCRLAGRAGDRVPEREDGLDFRDIKSREALRLAKTRNVSLLRAEQVERSILEP